MNGKRRRDENVCDKFGPQGVRVQLENLDFQLVIDQDRYRLLSERAVHVHPEIKPQSYNILGIPIAGANVQLEGVLVCLNELAIPLSMATGFGVQLLDLENHLKVRIISAAISLLNELGGAVITEIGNYHLHVREITESREELILISSALRRLQSERHK